MGKNPYKEKWEQVEEEKRLAVDYLKNRVNLLEIRVEEVKTENATLKERLRLVKIAATEGE